MTKTKTVKQENREHGAKSSSRFDLLRILLASIFIIIAASQATSEHQAPFAHPTDRENEALLFREAIHDTFQDHGDFFGDAQFEVESIQPNSVGFISVIRLRLIELSLLHRASSAERNHPPSS